MKKLVSTLFLFLLFSLSAYSQSDTIITIAEKLDWGRFEELALFSGYNFNQKDSIGRHNHLIEIGISKSKYSRYIHSANFNYYAACEILMAGEEFYIGPKIGAYLGGFFVIGTEITYYSDFEDWAIKVSPFFGIGHNAFKISGQPNLNIIKKGFDLNHFGTLKLTIQFLSLKKEKLENYY